MLILGISAFYHDSAACLIRDGEIVAAAQEERFTRKKHDPAFPKHAITSCLKEVGASIDDIDHIAFYERSDLKLDRLIKTQLMHAPAGMGQFLRAAPVWLLERLWLERGLRKTLGYKGPMAYPRHHDSHAASAFFPSPFERAAFLTMDGVGEWTTLSYGVGHDNNISTKKEIRFPHSLGLLYSAFTYYCGFKVNSGEYKLMGLAPYGKPKYTKVIFDNLLDLKEDGSFRLNIDYFDYCVGTQMTNRKFDALFGRPPRKPETPIEDLDMDLAASIQAVTEEAVLRIGKHIHGETGEKKLCMSGGVALNCVANGRLLREGPFDDIWIQPASGDAGSALGAALWTWHVHKKMPRVTRSSDDTQKGSFLGPAYGDAEIKRVLDGYNADYQLMPEAESADILAQLLADGNVIGWFNGRMEFGPRALGARSIIADARSPEMQRTLNLKIKYRESFRPFAPMVLAEDVDEWFDLRKPGASSKQTISPYMLMVGHVKNKYRHDNRRSFAHDLNGVNEARSQIPAVTHVDYSARIQTVHKQTNLPLHQVMSAFKNKTGCPVLVNTSFNVRGEPIVESPADAYVCFMRTEMDYLVIGSYLLDKKTQPTLIESQDWKAVFELD